MRWMRFREAGVSTLVSALTPAEVRELGLDAEADAAEAAGLRYVELPIEDRSTPTLTVAQPTLRQLAAEVQAGRHVAIHCRFGIGRSSLIAAALLVMCGSAPQLAWARISEARGLPVPDTDEQRAWLDLVVR